MLTFVFQFWSLNYCLKNDDLMYSKILMSIKIITYLTVDFFSLDVTINCSWKNWLNNVSNHVRKLCCSTCNFHWYDIIIWCNSLMNDLQHFISHLTYKICDTLIYFHSLTKYLKMRSLVILLSVGISVVLSSVVKSPLPVFNRGIGGRIVGGSKALEGPWPSHFTS